MRVSWSSAITLWLSGWALALLLVLGGCASRLNGPQPTGARSLETFFSEPPMPIYRNYQPTGARAELAMERVADNLYCGLARIMGTETIARAGCRRWLGKAWGPWEPANAALDQYLWPYQTEHAL